MSWVVGQTRGNAFSAPAPAVDEPTLNTTGPRVSLANVGATLTPTWAGSEITINVGDNWQTVINAHPAGTIFRVATGTHRRTCVSVSPKSSMQFIGEPGAIVSGCALVPSTGWTQNGSVWSMANTAWPASVDGGVGPGAFNAGYEAERYREDLFIDKLPLIRLGSGGTGGAASFTATPGAGQWSYDTATRTIYLGQNPAGHVIEVSFDMDGTDRMMQSQTSGTERITLKNLIIEGYATSNQDGAIVSLDAGGGETTDPSFPCNAVTNGYDYAGNTPEGGTSSTLGGWLIDHCQVRMCHSVGIFLGPGSIMQDSIVDYNGQVGCKGGGRNVGLLRCSITDNNYTHYDVFVEAGGFKGWNVTNMYFADCELLRNRGSAAWVDYTWDGHVIEYCRFQDNTGSGVACEMTEGCEIRYCQFLGNASDAYIRAQTDPDGAANYWSGQIWGYNSRNYNVHHNYVDTMATGWGGFALQEQERAGVSPLSQGTGSGATSGPYIGLRATCAGSQFQHNAVWMRSTRNGNVAGWRGIVTTDYGVFGSISTGKAAGWILRTDTDYGIAGSYPYALTINNNFYHLPRGALAPNSDVNLESGASTNYAWYPFRWDGQWGAQVLVGGAPYTASNLYQLLDSGRRFGNFAQWTTPLAAAGIGTGGFGVDTNSTATYDQG